MIQDIRETLRSSRPTVLELRRFGIILAILVIALAATAGVWPPSFLLVSLAGIVALIALVTPVALRPIHFLLMVLTIPIGWIISRSLLTILFFLIVTPTGFLIRILGKDPLERKRKSKGSYWEPFETNRNPGSMGL